MGKILVTGGAGYIGSHTVVELQQEGYEVVIADNLSNSSPDVPDRIARITGKQSPFVRVDLTDAGATDALFRDHPGISSVIHFAAFKAVGESVAFPLKYYRNNILSLINILESMNKHGVRDLVFSSSCTVYGQPDLLPVREDTPVRPASSPYGNTKQICEEIITDTSAEGTIHACLLRYFNPIGAHASTLIGELPTGVPDSLMPYITQTAIGKRPFLRVWGDDYNTPDGTAIRDYLHVTDLAKAHIRALDRMASGRATRPVEMFNLGTGHGFSVMEVIRSFERTSGTALPYEIHKRRPGDVEQIWADASLANSELGWKAELTLDDMTRSAWQWELALRDGIGK